MYQSIESNFIATTITGLFRNSFPGWLLGLSEVVGAFYNTFNFIL